MKYTDEETKLIDDAWYQLKRVVESDYHAKTVLDDSYKTEFKDRKDSTNTKIQIMREIYNHAKIKKHNIFSYSKGIRDCIVMADNIFYKYQKFNNEKIKLFKKKALLAINAHNQYMDRMLNAITGI